MTTTSSRSATTDDASARAGPITLAEDALRLARVDPVRAASLSREAEDAALAEDDWSATSVARRAAGVAALQLRQLDQAVERLEAAVRAAERSQDRHRAGEAHMSLASALVLRGDPNAGFAAMDAALTELNGPAAARARTQRAALFQELGRIDEALEDLRRALPALRRAGDVQWETQALSNRSLLLNTRRRFAAAEADLRRAHRLCLDHNLLLEGAAVEHNLGCVHADRGDIPVALQHFDRAAEGARSLGLEMGALSIDRAKVLLSARLVAEARAAAEAAVATFSAQGERVHLPEAQLILSTVALVENDLATATTAAAAASRAFARLGRWEWRSLARYASLQAAVAAAGGETNTLPAGGDAGLFSRLITSAAELERAGWVVPALEARLVAAQLALKAGRPRAAQNQLVRAAAARRSGPADVRSRAWLAEALLRQARGSRRGARSALRAGLRVVEDYRASMGATELRAHVSVHRGALARAGLRMALADRDARAVHLWSERGRASTNPIRSARPPDDPVLVQDLQDLRMTMAEIDEIRSSGGSTTGLVARQVQLERRIRDQCRRSAYGVGLRSAAPPTISQLAAELDQTALVEYVEIDETLHAVTVVGGRARLHRLGSAAPVRHWMSHLPFALHRLAHPATRPKQLEAAGQVLRHAASGMQEVLFTPLAAVVGDRSLVVVPTGWLQSVPWSLLPACAGRPVSVAPSATLWYEASRRSAPPSGVVVVAGPGLSGADAEAAAVARLHPGSTLLTGAAATSSAVATTFLGARIAHVAAHGTVRADNPLFSSLLLADGPFTVYDLESVSDTPHQVVLAACDTALSHVTAGEEILGLAAALLTRRTSTLVAPVVPIPDAETVALMTTYHRRLRRGDGAAAALAYAQQRHRDSDRAIAGSAGFICLGAGHRPVFGPS